MSLALKYRMKKMARGGEIRGHEGTKETGREKGVHEKQKGTVGAEKGNSVAGDKTRWHGSLKAAGLESHKADLSAAKSEHKRVLSELKSMPSPKLPMAEGGEVCMHCGGDMYAGGGDVKGVHKPFKGEGTSIAGEYAREGKAVRDMKAEKYIGGAQKALAASHEQMSKDLHKAKLAELRSMKSPKLYAEGGEIADFDSNDFEDDGFYGDEANYTAENSGDELGDDLVKRVMAKRKK